MEVYMGKVLTITVFLAASVLAGSWASAQAAGCRYNGQVYPVGAKLGNLTCAPGGVWKQV
jgi:hypothetical protein